MSQQRRKAFSGAQKKQQLKEKRQKKSKGDERYTWDEDTPHSGAPSFGRGNQFNNNNNAVIIQQPQLVQDDLKIITEDDEYNSEGEVREPKPQTFSGAPLVLEEMSVVTAEHALRTVFEKENKEELQKRINASRRPIKRLSGEEVSEEIKVMDQQYKALDMPIRPPWSHGMNKEELEANEKRYFQDYLETIYRHADKERLNYFEHNLEVWRQLWRVVEMSDILLLIADARYPLFHFPASLYDYVAVKLKKPLIFVLNKVDLLPKAIVEQWIQWFNQNYPLLQVVPFSSYKLEKEQQSGKKNSKKINRTRRLRYVDISLVNRIWEACKKLNLQEKFPDIDEYWNEMTKRADAMNEERKAKEKSKKEKSKHNNRLADEDSEDEFQSDEEQEQEEIKENNQAEESEEKKKEDSKMITLGLIGHPNVGKSCVLNALVGKTVVSTSYTPGHTKHWQTYPLSKHVRLCDCPGLVFPAVDMPKQLQVLCGIFPIAQLREPYSSVQYLAERIPVEEYYKLKIPEDYEEWSSWALCEAYALKRGYLTPKAARPDVYRAANEILRDVLFGRLLLYFLPPSENKNQSSYQLSKQTSTTTSSEQNVEEEAPAEPEAVEVEQITLKPKSKKKSKAAKAAARFAMLENEFE